MGRVTARRRVVRVEDGHFVDREETVAGEEPLEIRVAGRPIAVTMRTPGDDVDLALGFLVTEGLIADVDDVAGARMCGDGDVPSGNTYNVVDVTLAPGVPVPDASSARAFYTTSSCGICGKASVDAVRTTSRWSPADDTAPIPPALLVTLPERLRAAQQVFARTGGVHAAAVFDLDGTLLCVREDVGRHNAVDKVVGWAAREGRLPLRSTILQVSGRASFELVQKAVMAGVPCLAAVSAPSSLAVELAAEAGVTLVGFLRGSSFNVYAGADRVTRSDAGVARRIAAG